MEGGRAQWRLLARQPSAARRSCRSVAYDPHLHIAASAMPAFAQADGWRVATTASSKPCLEEGAAGCGRGGAQQHKAGHQQRGSGLGHVCIGRVSGWRGQRERAVLMALTLGAFMGACNLGRRRASWRVSYQPWARCYLPWSHQLSHLRTRMAASSELMCVSVSRSNGGLQAGRQGGRRTGARWCRATTWRISRLNDVALYLANRLNVTRLSDGQIHWAEGWMQAWLNAAAALLSHGESGGEEEPASASCCLLPCAP